MENSAINLLRTLGCKHIEVEVQPETVFEVEFESCLELHFCWLALLLIWITFHILLLNSDKVAVNIFLAEVVRIAHRLDEIDNVLWVSAPAWATLHTEPRSPIYFLTTFCLCRWHRKRRLLKILKLLVLLLLIVTRSGSENHVTRGLGLLGFLGDILHFNNLL